MSAPDAPPSHPRVGDPAPPFALPRVAGGEFVLAEQRGASLLWFSRGFGCPFCRRSMAQLSVVQEELEALEIVPVQISPNLLSAARLYYQVGLPTLPMLCDPDLTVYHRYGLQDRGAVEATRNALRSFSQGVTDGEFAKTVRANWLDNGNRQMVARLGYHTTKSYEQALFLVDGAQRVRARWLLEPLAALPLPHELLAGCAAALA